jgi:signal transduction histidine kinase
MEWRTAGIYLLVGWSYLLFSSYFAALFPSARDIEIVKGLAFIFFSAVLIFVLLRVQLRRQRQLQEQLSRQQRQLVEGERRSAVGLVAASLGHEIKNMLMVISAAMESVADKDSADLVFESLRRLDTHSRELLSLGRSKASPHERVDARAAILGTVKLVEFSRRTDNLKIVVHVPESLNIEGDPLEISQVLFNLIVNAADAAGAGGTVWIEARGGSDIRIVVSDSGPGVSPAILPSLFHSYVTSKGERGTGLGLLICRDLARKHGGDLTLLDPGGVTKGAVFEFRLPNAPDSVPKSR